MEKSLDRKLASIHADPSGARDFILADAKDADMAFGIGSPGRSPESHPTEGRFRTLAEYRDLMRQIVRQGDVDIMLMSTSSNDQLAIQERLFDHSHVTPAARANDTSDIFVVRGNQYITHPSRPFRTAAIDHIQCGHVDCAEEERTRGANLGLYSITFNNRLTEDMAALEQYNHFREEAERKGFRHFLEVFDPNSPEGLSSDDLPKFVNDCIARTLAGVARAGRPLFLKVVYHGPRAMEELVAYDPHLIVGILGGGAGTTYDAFKLLAEAQKHGARVALFGRKINQAENQLAFVAFLRLIVEGAISPEDAVKAYHAVLEKLGISPLRKLADDLLLQTNVMSYSGRSTGNVARAIPTAVSSTSSTQVSTPAESSAPEHDCGCGGHTPAACACEKTATPITPGGLPDFAHMTRAEKLAWNKSKRDRIFGT